MLEPWLRIGDHAIAFDRPDLLWLAWLAPLFAIVALLASLVRRDPYRRRSEPAWRLWLATLLRTVAYLCLVGAVCGASAVEVQRWDRLSVTALVDRSSSMSAAEGRWMDDWLAGMVGQMRSDDQLAVVGFGRESRIEAGPGKPSLAGRAAAQVDPAATNLMAALDSGASLAGTPGAALVLLSDGNETAGDAVAAAESARRRGQKIFPIVPPREQAPLSIEHVAAPSLVREGRDLRLAVAIANLGTSEVEATLVARQGTTELGRVPVRVAPGHSVVDAEVRAGAPGHYAISVALEAAPEVASARARRIVAVTVLPRPRVLLVSRDAVLEPLLREAGYEVSRVATLADTSANDLARYHAVVLGEITRRDLSPEGQRALETYVRDLGGGLLVAAGRGPLADAGMRNSPLERILPVKIEEQPPPKREREPIALFLVIDRSSSMSYGMDVSEQNPTRIAYAREAALALIGQLSDRDQVGAAAFDTQTSLLAPLAPLAVNRDKLNDLISRLVPSGGTDFKEALEIAARQLIASGRQTKHVILLTDGASIRPANEHDSLIAALAQSGVTVTSIRIGNDHDSYALVQAIAAQTGGNFYLVTDGTSLPNLMIQDTAKRSGQKLAREREREERGETGGEPFRPHVRPGTEALGGLRDEELPLLRGFASVPLKSGAEEWLWTDHTGKRLPILAAWQNGLGRVAVFTADPSPEWQSWSQVRRFWSQLIRWVARPESGDELRLALRREHGRALLGIDTYDGAEGGDLSVRVSERDGAVHDLTPTPLGARHFELALPPLESIEPRVQVSLRRKGAVVFTRDQWLPTLAASEEASDEDPEAAPNWALLSQLAEITGGAVNPPLATVLARAPADRQISFPLSQQLAIAALLLALVDIGVRLIALPDAASWR